MTVPEGKKVYIGNREYKAGDELPKGYVIPEKKKSAKPAVKPEKVENE